jgi:hypothetical protein
MYILTFDIEDWYLSYPSSQIDSVKWDNLEYRTERNTDIILSVLDDLHLKATFFFLGYEVRKNRNLLLKVQKQGHELGFHSMWHVPPQFLGKEKFSSDIKEGLSLMRDLSGQEICLYRAPVFSWNKKCDWFPEVLLENGIKIDSSTVAGRKLAEMVVPNHPFVWDKNGSELFEFPLSAFNCFQFKMRYSGSGFFRMLPEPVLHYLFSKSAYHMLYFHPRDFDLKVPSSPYLPWYRNYMNRIGNHTSKDKLINLAQRIRLISLGEAYNLFREKLAFGKIGIEK